MADPKLVREDREAGNLLLAALDEKRVNPTAAFWLHDPEADRWELWLALPEAARDLKKAYLSVAEVLRANPSIWKQIELSRTNIVAPDAMTVQLMGRLLRVENPPSAEPVIWHRNVINGVLIEDAVVYRLAA
jgi:hypothetical protein